jgi:hypothetical protein
MNRSRISRAICNTGVIGSHYLYAAAILDQLSAPSAAAYSLRKLRNAYTGNAIRVRRSSDNAEADIGFTANGDLDTTALLAHVGSQNLLLRSQEFENAAWEGLAGSAETIAANSEIAPDGTLTAERCTVLSSTSGRYQTLTLAAAGQITCSLFIKAGSTGTWARIGFFDTAVVTNQARCWVNMLTGAIGTVSTVGSGWSNATASSTPVGNGWYRISLTATSTATAISVINTAADADNSTSRTIGQNRIIWGAQLNTGATAQPYYATTNVVRTTGDGFVTTWYDQSGNGRNATQTTAGQQPRIVSNGVLDISNGKPAIRFNGSNTFFSGVSLPLSQLTLSSVLNDVTQAGDIRYSIGTGSGLLGRGIFSSFQFSSNKSLGYIPDAGVPVVQTGFLPTIGQSYVVSLTTTATASSIWANGGNNATGGIMTLNQLFIGQRGDNFWYYDGYNSETIVFPSALSTTDRQTLERNQGGYYTISVS